MLKVLKSCPRGRYAHFFLIMVFLNICWEHPHSHIYKKITRAVQPVAMSLIASYCHCDVILIMTQPPFLLWCHSHCNVICYWAGHAHHYRRTYARTSYCIKYIKMTKIVVKLTSRLTSGWLLLWLWSIRICFVVRLRWWECNRWLAVTNLITDNSSSPVNSSD